MTKVELRAVTVRWVGVVRLRQKHDGNSSDRGAAKSAAVNW